MVVFGLAYCNAQETQAYIFGRNVRKFSKALIDDRPIYSKFTILNSRSVVALENDHKPLSYSYTHQSKMASMDLSPPQLMLQIRTNFNDPNNILMLCGYLEVGLYRNYDSKDFIIGTGKDYLINNIIIRQLLNRRSLLRKY